MTPRLQTEKMSIQKRYLWKNWPTRLVVFTCLYLVKVFMPHWEREGESKRKFFVFDLVLVQEVRDALGNVVKQLGEKGNRN